MKFDLKIIGTGRDEEFLRTIAGPTVEFLGNVSDQEFKNIFTNAKAFLFASKDEEFGIAVVEAMGYRLPVIAYNSGGIPEYIKNGLNGYLFDSLNPISLIKKIKEFEKLNKEQVLKMKQEARNTAEKFNEENFKKNILNFVKTHARTSRS
jgi:glycosyltransferase involved in cell wall biosynthesis